MYTDQEMAIRWGIPVETVTAGRAEADPDCVKCGGTGLDGPGPARDRPVIACDADGCRG